MTEAVLVVGLFAALLTSFLALVPAANRGDFNAPARAHARVRDLLPCASPWQRSLDEFGSGQPGSKRQ